jgi:hypothetical protein
VPVLIEPMLAFSGLLAFAFFAMVGVLVVYAVYYLIFRLGK